MFAICDELQTNKELKKNFFKWEQYLYWDLTKYIQMFKNIWESAQYHHSDKNKSEITTKTLHS